MKAAFTFATLGAGLAWFLSTRVLGLEIDFVFRGVLAANFAGFTSLLGTLALERRPSTKATLLKGNLRTWAFLSSFFLIIFFGALPEVRELRPFLILFPPLLLTTGFMMPIFGKAQDRLIAREQRRARPT